MVSVLLSAGEMMQNPTDEKISLPKTTIYGLVVVVLSILLVASVLTQGFGIAKEPTKEAAEAQPSEAAQPSAPTAPSAPSPAAEPSAPKASIIDLMDDDMKLGSDSAPLVLVEFSDFQCPYCRLFWSDSYSQIKSDYVDTGKLQIVYRDFPLSFHPAAQKSAEAVECAADQDKGWELHDKLYGEEAKLGQGTVEYSVEDIKSWAADIGLDIESFNDCLDSGKYYDEVQQDMNEGVAAGVRGTPAFLLGKRDGNQVLEISGAQPYSVFKSAIDSLLE